MPTLAAEISLLRDDREVHTVPLVEGALFIGRSPDNDLPLSLPAVSSRHAVLHLTPQGDRVLLRDLGSTNGTFLNDQPVSGPVAVADGDLIRLGAAVRLRVRLAPGQPHPLRRAPPTLLDDLDTGLRYPVRTEHLVVGSGPACQVRAAGLPEDAACCTLQRDGTVWVSTEDREFPVVAGEPFAAGGHRWVFRHDRAAFEATAREMLESVQYPYELEVQLDGPEGPRAKVSDAVRKVTGVLHASNQVSLLWVLGGRLQADFQAGAPAETAGWCSDEEVMAAIWGRGWQSMDANNLQVLIHRARSGFRKAGLDGWFIEKRLGQTRVRVRRVTLL